VCVVGGEERDVEEIRPLIEQIGSSIFVSGPVGSAKAMKLVNNLMAHATLLICAEAFQIGVASGVEPERLFEMLSQMGLELAQSAGVPAPPASLVRSLYAIAAAEGLAEDDIVALLKLYRRWTAS
jgi:3-hydroxyisobutyrate dehydrogenase-like beta-hydroxyacid dehydrogenase